MGISKDYTLLIAGLLQDEFDFGNITTVYTATTLKIGLANIQNEIYTPGIFAEPLRDKKKFIGCGAFAIQRDTYVVVNVIAKRGECGPGHARKDRSEMVAEVERIIEKFRRVPNLTEYPEVSWIEIQDIAWDTDNIERPQYFICRLLVYIMAEYNSEAKA